MYALEIRKHVDQTFKKLSKKDPKQMAVIAAKLKEILQNPHRYKQLRVPLAGIRRVHLDSYVLLFSVDEMRKSVVLEDYEHHDKVYRRRTDPGPDMPRTRESETSRAHRLDRQAWGRGNSSLESETYADMFQRAENGITSCATSSSLHREFHFSWLCSLTS